MEYARRARAGPIRGRAETAAMVVAEVMVVQAEAVRPLAMAAVELEAAVLEWAALEALAVRPKPAAVLRAVPVSAPSLTVALARFRTTLGRHRAQWLRRS